MALTKITDSIVDFDSLEILTSASDTGVDLTLNGNKSSNGAVGSLIFENNTDSVAMIRASRVGGNNDAADLSFFTQATGGSNTERMTISSSGTVTFTAKDSVRVSTLGAVGQTGSGAMFILGHNAHVDESTNNTVKAIAGSWYPSFIKMYYNHGITFHTNTTTQSSAGDTLLSGTGANNLEKLRIDNYALHSGGMMRTSGWYNNNNGYSTNQALETGTTGSYSYCLSYNRTSSAYGGLMLSGDTVRFQTGGNQRLIVDDSYAYPYTDNAYDLGASGARFDDIYATNNSIQTSDRNEKNTITDTDLGLDFINRLSPKSYKFNSGTRTHYGLIAQDIEDVLEDINKPTADFAGFIKNQKYRTVGEEVTEEDGVIVSEPTQEIVEGEHTYGLRYSEFISPMIKAIQELKAENDSLKTRIETLENA